MTAVPDAIAGGQRLGRYELIRRLAVGGMAEIYLARVPGVGIEGFEKVVVLKRILPQHALDPELLRMFLDEARLTATLTHPHVTAVYDVGTSGDAPFFTMEYVHGANLRMLMREVGRAARAGGDDSPAPMPLEQAIGIVAAAASGLHYAHDKLGPGGEPLNIVHRDVSPSNVLVSYDGAVKVSDFGIAKWAFQRTQTQDGALKGKFAYMSPEQCKGQPLDRRSDVFALGTILYETTTGTSPFHAESDFDILNQIVSGSPRPPELPPSAGGARAYPVELAAIVLRALARDPADRYPTAQALQLDLEAFARAGRLEVSTVALAGYVQTLFAEELAAWHEAQRAGKSLGEHLAEGRGGAGAAPGSPTLRTATDAFAATRPAARGRRRKRAFAAAVLAVGVAVGGAMVGARLQGRWAGADTHTTGSTHATATTTTTTTTSTSTSAATGGEVSVGVAGSTEKSQATNVESHSSQSTTRPSPRRRARARAEAASEPSLESKLGKWDPDSPVPP